MNLLKNLLVMIGRCVVINQPKILGFIAKDTFIHRLSGTCKLVYLILVSIACMTSYDTRFLLAMTVFSLFLFKISHIKWQQVAFVMKFIFFFSLLNLIAVYIFSPEYGCKIYGTKTVIFEGFGRFSLTYEQLFYEFNLLLKYVCTIPLAIVFLLSTNPSEFASSLNKIGVSYKICYAVSLALRYIPDIQEDFFTISFAQQARGFELSKKAPLLKRMKGVAKILIPLVLSSLDRIEGISTAMELRRFGTKKRRTWYKERQLTKKDVSVIILAVLLLSISLLLFSVNGSRFYNPF